MQRTAKWAAAAILTVLIAGSSYAGPNDASPAPKEAYKPAPADQAGSGQGISPATQGSSVVERDKKRYGTRKRASERRAMEMKKAKKAKQPAKPGSTVVERDKKRYDIQKRAAEQRAVEMKKGGMSPRDGDGKSPEPTDGQGRQPSK